jgi:hypothetical protein
MSPRSGSFGTYLGLLRSQQLIQDDGERFSPTELGIQLIGGVDPVSYEEIIDNWKKILTGGARRMFETLISIYPEAISREELGERVGMSSGSGSFGTYLGKLRSNELIENSNGGLKASDNLFN